MHYYQFHIGDYQSDTRHLELMEDLAYRRMLDLYYKTENPLPIDVEEIARLVGMRTHSECIAIVLKDFFERTDDGWRNNKADRFIGDYRKAKRNHWGQGLSREKRAELQAARNASKLKATPSWLSDAHKREISETYRKSRARSIETGIPHEVDHIVPLRSSVACGLHVPWNLRVIGAANNRAKGNLLQEDSDAQV